MTGPTPGPWGTSALCTAHENKEWTICAEVGGDIIADLTLNPNAEADARLIAAAPDLLAALQSVVRRWVDSDRVSPLAWAMAEDARAAIAAAGGAP